MEHLKKHIKKKLQASQGETITETLAAILIAALSCTMLMGAVAVSAQMNKSAATTQDAFQEQLNEAERRTGTVRGSVTIAVQTTPPGTYAYQVLYTGGEGKLTSYQLKPTEPAAPDPNQGDGGP